MMIDRSLTDEYFDQLADRYTAAELVEEMGLTTWDIIVMFEEDLIEKPIDADKYRTQ
jgi:hypothetical protein